LRRDFDGGEASMNKRVLGIVALVVVIAAAGLFGWWWTDLRWRPHTLDKHQPEIQAMLDSSGWVSPGLSKTKVLWMVSYRSCPDCVRFEEEEFPRLHKAGVDTRVIMAPRPRGTTPAERSTIAALWTGRSWKLYDEWTHAPIEGSAAWDAPGVPSADADPARLQLVSNAHSWVESLRPLLKDNGVNFAYPTLIWRDAQGRLRGCACEKRETYRFVRRELGIPNA